MEENAKTEQHLDDEQLQDVTGGGVFSLFGRSSSRADTLSQIDSKQLQATMASKGAAQLSTKNPVISQRQNEAAAMHMEQLNNLNTKVRGF